jgi:DNA mismatch repair protein MutS
VLARLEKQHGKPRAALEELPLFAALAPAPEEESVPLADIALAAALAELNPDAMTPREALDALYRLKALG